MLFNQHLELPGQCINLLMELMDGTSKKEYHLIPKGYACPCCDFLTRLEEEFGTYEICPVCFWEDDPLQAENPSMAGGANKISLNEARRNFLEYGSMDKEFIKRVRKPLPDEIP